MIELKILVDDIDYNSLTELLVPLLAEKLETVLSRNIANTRPRD